MLTSPPKSWNLATATQFVMDFRNRRTELNKRRKNFIHFVNHPQDTPQADPRPYSTFAGKTAFKAEVDGYYTVRHLSDLQNFRFPATKTGRRRGSAPRPRPIFPRSKHLGIANPERLKGWSPVLIASWASWVGR
jgi:hypothetical protein